MITEMNYENIVDNKHDYKLKGSNVNKIIYII